MTRLSSREEEETAGEGASQLKGARANEVREATFTHTHTRRERERERQTDRYTHMHTDRQTVRQSELRVEDAGGFRGRVVPRTKCQTTIIACHIIPIYHQLRVSV